MPREGINRQDRRNEGSVTISVLAIVIVLFALAAGVTQLSTVTMRASATSTRDMRLFYLADSGVHIGSAMIRAAGGLPGTTFFEQSLAGGSISVNIASETGGFSVTSTGTLDGEQVTVEMRIALKIIGGYVMQGAAEIFIDDGTELEGDNLAIELNGTSKISGMDHDALGILLVDQTAATRGLAMNQVPGDSDFDLVIDILAGAILEGSPDASTNTASDQGSVIEDLRDYAKDNADVYLGGSGSHTLGDAQTGSYGTAIAPKLVYVDLKEEKTVTLTQGFTGYGTLFIDMEESEDFPALMLNMTASWNGPVILNMRDEAEVDGNALIELQNSSRILGGLVVNLAGEEVELDSGGKLLRTLDSSSILYSSVLLGTAPGFNSVVAGTTSLETVSYRSL